MFLSPNSLIQITYLTGKLSISYLTGKLSISYFIVKILTGKLYNTFEVRNLYVDAWADTWLTCKSLNLPGNL